MTLVDDALQSGTLLCDGRFEVVEAVGRGGFGITYKARDHHRDRRIVALKEFFPDGEGVRQGVEIAFPGLAPGLPGPSGLVVAEARRQERLQHPAVARTLWSFSENNTAYIAMEWIEGATLLELYERNALNESIITKVYLTVLDAIMHFGRSNLAHRDLNPRNIMVRRDDGCPIVIDFGLARQIGVGNTILSRTPAGVPALMPPEQFTRHGWQDIWTDIFTLSATLGYVISGQLLDTSIGEPLADLKERGVGRVAQYSDALLRCLDKGMARKISDRLRTGREALSILGLDEIALRGILAREVFEANLLLKSPDRLVGGVSPSGKPDNSSGGRRLRFQRALLQSFDTARFQETSLAAGVEGTPTVPVAAKVALARTEAVLNILFAREIVVPAGQVAESPAFITLFSEIMKAYLPLAARIDKACEAANLPPFQPFRLALEEREMVDYAGFVQRYKFTGAPLKILQSAGMDKDSQEARGRQMEAVKALFLREDYDALEKAVGQNGFGAFAKLARTYFDGTNSVFASRNIPQVSANEYSLVFFRRLSDEDLSGSGLAEARASLELVEEIDQKLRGEKNAGYRGNWYLFAKDFGRVWPLARAYLDTRLYVTLSQQYAVDHPILVSQEFEYGAFDHSLFLGPRYSESLNTPERSNLLRISSSMGPPIDWTPIFELFLDRAFLGSIRRMNGFYHSSAPMSEDDHLHAIDQHGAILEKTPLTNIRVRLTDDQFLIETTNGSDEVMAYQAYDAVGRNEATRVEDRSAAASALSPYGDSQQNHAAIRLLPTSRNGLSAGVGEMIAQQILHYYMKPYRLLATEGL